MVAVAERKKTTENASTKAIAYKANMESSFSTDRSQPFKATELHVQRQQALLALSLETHLQISGTAVMKEAAF